MCHCPSLHEDVIIEILLRLPVKSLLRFNAVCERWHAIIKSPRFVRDHFHLESNCSCLLVKNIVYVKSREKYTQYANTFSWLRGEKLEICEDVYHRELIGSRLGMKGPCNGIFCVLYPDRIFALWNPATRRLRPLPRCPLDVTMLSFGFGIDLITNDFKIVVFDSYSNPPCFAVYKLSDNSWMLFEDEAIVASAAYADDGYSALTFSNGFCYCMKRPLGRCDFAIIAFDIHRQLFQEIEIPKTILNSSSGGKFYWYDDSLALLTPCSAEKHFDAWLLNQQGCWVKISTISLPFEARAIRFCKRNQIFAVTGDWKLMVYNVDSRKTREVEFQEVEGVCVRFPVPIPYKESLISLW